MRTKQVARPFLVEGMAMERAEWAWLGFPPLGSLRIPGGSCGNTEGQALDVLIQQVCARGSAFLIRFPGGAAGVDMAGLGSTF